MGDGGDMVETCADQRLHQIEPIKSTACKRGGDVGDVGDVLGESRAREILSAEEVQGERENLDYKWSKTGTNVSHVSHVSTESAIDTKQRTIMVETLRGDVSTTSPPRLHTGQPGVIDLASLAIAPLDADKDPP